MNDKRGGHTVVVFQLPKLTARVRFPSPAPFFLICCALCISGCATTEYKHGGQGQEAVAAPKKEGSYHKVQKGQTLWRIAKAYAVPVEDIIQSNNIPNAAAIEVDQLIFIPGSKDVKEVPAYAPDENKDEFTWPLKGKVISYFNDAKGAAFNRGVDIEAQEGDTVKAAREGRVILADYLSGYGQAVMIDHGDGFISVYAKNVKLMVKLGEYVYKGSPIALVGHSGKRTFLHFQVRKGIKAVNPLYYLP